MWLPHDTYIFAILGSDEKECEEGKKLRPARSKNNENTRSDYSEILSKTIHANKSEFFKKENQALEDIRTIKYINYYMTSQGILLKRLAKYYGIPDKNVLIMAKGKKEIFFLQELTNNKLYVQLRKTEIFMTDIKEEEMDFIFFDPKYANYEIILKIKNFIHKENARILFFIGDREMHNKFLNLYLPFYTFPHASLRVFIDGCQSQTTTGIVERFFTITDIIKNETSGKGVNIKNIEYIAKIALSYDKNRQLSSIQDEITKLESIYHTNIPSLPDNKLKLTRIGTDVTAYKGIITKDNQNLLPYFEEGGFWNYDCEIFSKLGLFKFSDLFIFKNIHQVLEAHNLEFSDTERIFNERNYRIAMKIYKQLDCKTSDDLIYIINEIRNQSIERSVLFSFGKFLISPHDDHVIVTTEPSNGSAVTFGAKRIKGSDVKVIMGSPGFGSFIDEVFLNVTPEKISIENIKQFAVNGDQTEKDEMEEFDGKKSVHQITYGEHIKKEWIKLRINDFSTENISNERFLNDTLLNKPPKRIEILKEIGFNLVQEFESDSETPIDTENDLFVKPKCRKRIRYVDSVFDSKEMVKDKSYVERGSVSINHPSEDEEYYSDDEAHDDTSYLRSSASLSISTAEDEGRDEDITELTEEEADKIIERLELPNYGWSIDLYQFITASLKMKTKKMKYPFDPYKEDNFNGINFNWARNTLKGFFPVCEICDATKLILLISDFAYQNELKCISLEEPVSKLIQSICRIGSQKIPRFLNSPNL